MLSRRLLRIKVIKTLYSHFKSESDSLISSEKNLMTSIDKTYDLYHQMLWLVVDVARLASSRIEIARNKKLPTAEDLNPNLRFVENRVIGQIEESDALGTYLSKRSLNWVNYPELIKQLYNALIEDDCYKAYMAKSNATYGDDLKMIEEFYIRLAEDNELLENVIEEQSILWADDLDFSIIMVLKTLSGCRPDQADLPLLPKYKQDEDVQFVKELFRRSLAGYSEYIEYIEKYTVNWDVERIAFMDNLIMVTAIAELVSFPSIPVKVTLDEYIEIAKYYSTPGSSVFINGVLDKVIVTLTEEGKIQKTGRGLL